MPSSAGQTCARSEEHTSELQSHDNLVCRLLLEKKQQQLREQPLPNRQPRPFGDPGTVGAPEGGRLTGGRSPFRVSPRTWASSASRFFFNDRATPEPSALAPRGLLRI